MESFIWYMILQSAATLITNTIILHPTWIGNLRLLMQDSTHRFFKSEVQEHLTINREFVFHYLLHRCTEKRQWTNVLEFGLKSYSKEIYSVQTTLTSRTSSNLEAVYRLINSSHLHRYKFSILWYIYVYNGIYAICFLGRSCNFRKDKVNLMTLQKLTDCGKELKKVCWLVGIIDVRNTAFDIFSGNFSIITEIDPPPKLCPTMITCNKVKPNYFHQIKFLHLQYLNILIWNSFTYTMQDSTYGLA